MNYIFRVSAQDENHSVVIKYGEEKMRVGLDFHDFIKKCEVWIRYKILFKRVLLDTD